MRRWRRPAALWRGRSAVVPALLLVAVFFAACYLPVLAGRSALLGGGSLVGALPWGAGPHPRPANYLLSDHVLQMLPWQQEVGSSLRAGRLPLWNPHAGAGSPLLANDQSAVFSPFTWLAVAFDPAVGLSLAMLAKLWVAGLGMALLLRRLGARGIAPLIAGVAYAMSSFVTVWLGHPAAAVAALMPWCFWAVEGVVLRRTLGSAAVLGLVLALQFLAGHAESSLDLGTALCLYALVRIATADGARVRLAGLLGGAGVWSVLVAAVQLLPFAAALTGSAVLGSRVGLGAGHPPLSAAASWLVPNAHGSPAVDGLPGRAPNYSESTGYAGVAMLLLSPLGAWWLARRMRGAAAALLAVTGLSAAAVYGALSSVLVHLPLFESSNNTRFIAVLCLGVVALGGLGVDALEQGARERGGDPRPFAVAGLGCAGALIVAWMLLLARGGGVDGLLPSIGGMIGFWVAIAALAAAATLLLAAAALRGAGQSAVMGLLLVVLAEGVLVSVPYNPRVPARVVPPSPAMAFLQDHAAEGAVAATGITMLPNAATLYGLDDVRIYDVLIPERTRDFWSAADPGYSDATLITELARPDVRHLALAGVAYVMTAGSVPLPGTEAAWRGEGVTIGRVPHPRPFAYAAAEVHLAGGLAGASRVLAGVPPSADVVEARCCAGVAGPARVRVVSPGPARVELDVDSATAQTVVVRQSYDPSWQAEVDGASTPVVPANVAFEAVRVPAGHHRVTLDYRPASLVAGAALSLAALLAGLAAPALLAARGRRQAAPPGSRRRSRYRRRATA